MGRLTTFLVFVLAVIAFLASAVIHVATYFDLSLTDRWRGLQWVFFAVFLISIVIISDIQERTNPRGRTYLFTAFEPRAKSVAEVASTTLLVYTFVVYLVGVLGSDPGRASRVDGKPVISRHGKIIRELSEPEYSHAKALEIRGFSALLCAFSGTDALELFSVVLLEKKKRTMKAKGVAY